MATREASVVIHKRRRPVESAHFGIAISTETWDNEAKAWKGGVEHAEASCSLRVKVDVHSGEDGAAAPEVEDIPVARAAGGRHPSLDELGSLTVEEDGDSDDWEAWFGKRRAQPLRQRDPLPGLGRPVPPPPLGVPL